MRLGDRMHVDRQVEKPPGGAEMPLLILQPLLWNAKYIMAFSLYPRVASLNLRYVLPQMKFVLKTVIRLSIQRAVTLMAMAALGRSF